LLSCGRYVGARDVLEEVLRDRDFYENSGGGITISGGEPLSHPEFVSLLLTLCREEGLHTALDTTGYAACEIVERVVKLVDLVLFDVKHLDPEKHRKATGVDNRLIMENLKRASRVTTTWLRVPLIAGFNDADEEIRELGKLGKSFGVEKISLLPYHEGGVSKSAQMGRAYRLPDGRAPDEERLSRLKEIIEEEGVTVSLGS